MMDFPSQRIRYAYADLKNKTKLHPMWQCISYLDDGRAAGVSGEILRSWSGLVFVMLKACEGSISNASIYTTWDLLNDIEWLSS
jgi:hypothetical protein